MPSGNKDLSDTDGKETTVEQEQIPEGEVMTEDTAEGRVSPSITGANDSVKRYHKCFVKFISSLFFKFCSE